MLKSRFKTTDDRILLAGPISCASPLTALVGGEENLASWAREIAHIPGKAGESSGQTESLLNAGSQTSAVGGGCRGG